MITRITGSNTKIKEIRIQKLQRTNNKTINPYIQFISTQYRKTVNSTLQPTQGTYIQIENTYNTYRKMPWANRTSKIR